MTLPNVLTIIRIVLVPVFAYLLLSDSPYLKILGVGVFMIAAFTDWIDGYYARKYGETSRLGAFLDPLADKILITTALLVYVWLDYIDLWMVIAILVRDIVVTALRVYAEWRNRPVVTSKSAKVKTFTQSVFAVAVMVIMLIAEPGLTGQAVSEWSKTALLSPITDWVMLTITIFAVYTGLSYLYQNRKHIIG